MASPGDSDGATQTSGSRDITMSCELQKATSLTMRELEEITDRFSKERAIGEGSYGRVYRGSLDNGEEIAVKLLHNKLETDDTQFRREFENLMRLQHRNIVRLVGYCYETQHKPMIYTGQTIFAEEISKALCFEYMPNGSLEKHLSEEYDGLDWHTRYKIIKGTCEGLQYLHEGFKEPIYHLDLKPDNILLDENMVPKLADFGLSRLFDGQKTMTMKSTVGTIGYMPPEYLFGNIISNKFDVFSLGVVMTRIIAGPRGHTRRAEMSHQEFLDQVENNWRNRLHATWSSNKQLEAHCEQVNICTEIALSCMENDRHKRPNIADIIHQLNDTESAIEKALSWSASSQSWMQGDLVKVRAFTRSKAILCGETCDMFPVLARVTAAPWCHTEEMPRAGVDVVLVLDIDMVLQWRLNAIKQALVTRVIGKLSPNDRLSIVSAVVEKKGHDSLKLTFMSDRGRDAAKLMLGELHAGKRGSNMIAALLEGAEILRGRGVEEGDSRVGCILLVSGDEDNEIPKQKIPSEFPVHTIGVQRHNPKVMMYIADKTCGTYSFHDEGDNYIEHGFWLFITGITSVAATSIKITLTAHQGVTISSIESGGYDNLVSSDRQSGVISINDMYAGERKNFIVYLRVEDGNSKKLVSIGGQYRSSIDTSKQLAEKDVFVLRPRSRCSPDKLTIHPEVASELTRIQLAKGLSAIAELERSFSIFYLQETWNQIRCSNEGRSATKETILTLGNDVNTMEIDAYKFGYYCYPKNVPYMMSWLSCHKWQRATTKGSRYPAAFMPLAQPSDGEDDDD